MFLGELNFLLRMMIIVTAKAMDRTMTATFSTSVTLKVPGCGVGELVFSVGVGLKVGSIV